MIFPKNSYLLLVSFIWFPLYLSADKEIYVDLTLQKAYAVENGILKFEGHISSGDRGHQTPIGRFKILQKDKDHVSNLYPKPNGGTKMPYMMRLTWDGIAMHQGYVPDRPVSHGCIRLKRKFAKKLFYWADKGTPVLIEGDTEGFYNYENSIVHYKKDKDGYHIIELYD